MRGVLITNRIQQLKKESHYMNVTTIKHNLDRLQEIENQFQLVDIHKKGHLSKSQILNYLQQKYQEVNMKVIYDLFSEMTWSHQNVTKEQFCTKYLAKQKHLVNQINKKKSYNEWLIINKKIFSDFQSLDTSKLLSNMDTIFGYFSIRRIQFMHTKALYFDISIIYEDNQLDTQYNLRMKQYDSTYESIELLFPVQRQHFFVTFQFRKPDHTEILGRGYIKVDRQNITLKQNKTLVNQIYSKGQKVGTFSINIQFMNDKQQIKNKLNQVQNKKQKNQASWNKDLIYFEYLEFLWGMKNKSPDKIQKLDVKVILILRTVIFFLLIICGVLNNIGGRYDPLSIILSLILLKLKDYVWLRHESFLILWISIFSMLNDIIWIVFSQYHNNVSQINYQNILFAFWISIFLIVVKIVFIGYVVFKQNTLFL